MNEPKDFVCISKRFDPFEIQAHRRPGEKMLYEIGQMVDDLIPKATEIGLDNTNCDLEIRLAYVRRVKATK